jgi:hypothetical protein
VEIFLDSQEAGGHGMRTADLKGQASTNQLGMSSTQPSKPSYPRDQSTWVFTQATLPLKIMHYVKVAGVNLDGQLLRMCMQTQIHHLFINILK